MPVAGDSGYRGRAMKVQKSILQIALGLLALVFLCSVSTLRAEEPKKEKGPSKADLKKYDANGDGQLDEAETAKLKADADTKKEAEKAARLAKYDTNKNGKIDKEEKVQEEADKAAAKAEKEARKAGMEKEKEKK